MKKLSMTVTEAGNVCLENVEVVNNPTYKFWRGQITQAETEGITCIPHNLTESDYLGFLGNPEDPQMGNGISFIPRQKDGVFFITLPFEHKDVYLSTKYIKFINGDEIFFKTQDDGNGFTSLEIISGNSTSGVFETKDGIINWLNFEVQVRQYYEN